MRVLFNILIIGGIIQAYIHYNLGANIYPNLFLVGLFIIIRVGINND